MRLILTIQDVKLKDTDELKQMIFGNLNVSVPSAEGVYDNKKNINFVMPLEDIRGMKKIVRNIQVSALALKQQERRKGRPLSQREVQNLG